MSLPCRMQARMKRLEGVRLEVDSRQRTVNALTTNLNKQRAGLPPNPTQLKTKGEVTVDMTIRKLTNKDNKLAGQSTLKPPCVRGTCRNALASFKRGTDWDMESELPCQEFLQLCFMEIASCFLKPAAEEQGCANFGTR